MFFYLSKTVALVAVPSNAMALVGFVGLILLPTRFARCGVRLLATSMVLVLLAGLTPLGNALTVPLENRFPMKGEQSAPAGIIVLGGMVDADLTAERHSLVLTDSAERITVLADLARRYPQARLVFTGGDPSLLGGGLSEAEAVLPLLDSFDIPRTRLEVEDRSRNTAENATFTRDLVQPKPDERWLLVTSAMHMPRSVGAFRHAGFTVEAYPVDYRSSGVAWDVRAGSRRIAARLDQVDRAAHEWIGLVMYRLTGRTSALFPSPRDL